MIQRIQSLYLFLATALMGAALVMDWSTYVYKADNAGYVLTGLGTSVEGLNTLPLTLTIVVGLTLLVVTLFGYKNRKLQMRMTVVCIVQLLLTVGMFGYVHYQAIVLMKVARTDELSLGYGVAFIFPIIALVLVWLARKAIKKDDDLVKSVDRLR